MINTYVAETSMSASEGILLAVFIGLYILIYGAILVMGITGYVLQGLGMYRIAERRGIHKPWLAWIPLANCWLLGSISDHYQYVAKQKVTKRRRTLLILEIALVVAYIAFIVSMFATLFSLDYAPTDEQGLGMILFMFLGMAILAGVAIAAMVFVYLTYFDLFRSCRPQNEVLFLILGIFVPITLPFFVFACSAYDYGMPPKRDPQEPAQIPAAPAEEAPAAEETSAEEVPAAEEVPVEESAEN